MSSSILAGSLWHERYIMKENARISSEKVSQLQRRSAVVDVAMFLLVIAGLSALTFQGTKTLGYNWQWYQIPHYIFSFEQGKLVVGPLIKGLLVTFQITGASLVLSFCFGLLTAIMRLSDSFAARGIARGYLELVRNTPLLVQLFFIYFVLGPIMGIGRFTCAVLALSLFEGAYASEIFRAGIVSIHFGQWEAAHSLGLSRVQTYRYVILPQAIRRILPPLTSQAVSLIKDSALVSTIAVYDLTMRGQEIVAETYLAFEVWFTVAAIYLAVTITLSVIINMMESKFEVVS